MCMWSTPLIRSIIAVVFALLLSCSQAVYAGQTILNTDAFTGTATTVLPTYSANWVTVTDGVDCIISTPNGGVAAPSTSTCKNYNTAATWTNDQFAEVTVTALGAGSSGRNLVCVRLTVSAALSGYCAGMILSEGDGNYRIWRFNDDGTRTAIAGPGAAMAASDVVNLEIVGSNLTLRVNGSTALTASDATFTTNNPGLRLSHNVAITNLVSSWKAGSVTLRNRIFGQ